MARTNRKTRRNSPLFLPSAFDLYRPSKDLILKNIWIFGPLYAVPFIFWLHSWIWSPTPGQTAHHWWHGIWNYSSGSPGSPLPTYSTSVVVGFSLLWLLIIIVGGTVVQIMSQRAQLDVTQGETLSFSVLWKQAKNVFWRMLGVYFITSVIVGVGLVLLVVPGVIMLRRYFFAPYILLEKNVGVFKALEDSTALSKLNPTSIYGIIGVMFLIALINIIPVVGGLASFAVGSLYSVAPALRYQQLKKLAS